MNDDPQVMEAMVCLQAGQFDQAEDLCLNVLARDPADLVALQVLASVKFVGGRHGEAVEVLEIALRHHPDNAQCRVMLGSTLRVLGRTNEAMTHYLRAIVLNPDLAEARNNLGVLYHDRGELESAIACYRQVLIQEPDHVGARLNLAAALHDLGRSEEALEAFQAILKVVPDHAHAGLMALHTQRELCRWPDPRAMVEGVRRIAATQPGKFSPLLLLAWPVAPDVILSAAKAFAATYAPPAVMPPRPAQAGDSGRKLHIGYFSSDLGEHVTASVLAEVLERHDRAAFEISAYSDGPDGGGPQRKRIQAACSNFIDIAALSDDDAARKMRDDGVDILIDLNGYTSNVRHGIPARRPAPVQISWLGNPGTTGSHAIDYLVADAFTIPPKAEAFYSESLIRLPGTSQPHVRARAVAEPQSRAAYGLPEDAFVFCAFSRPLKISPEIFQTWMSALKAVPKAVLWLRADHGEVLANLRKEALDAGVAEDRLVFAARTPKAADHLARYRVADLALDTFPFNAHTTALDALWQGCPVLTVAGDTFAARRAGGVLHGLGLPELVTNSLGAYRDAAVRLATRPVELAALRAKLGAARDRAPHLDAAQFTRHLEAGLRTAWSIYAAGQRPRHITVTAP